MNYTSCFCNEQGTGKNEAMLYSNDNHLDHLDRQYFTYRSHPRNPQANEANPRPLTAAETRPVDSIPPASHT